jgi:hypothetical protein
MALGTTITSEVYCETLNTLWRSIQNKQQGMLTKDIVLLHDEWPHTVACTNALPLGDFRPQSLQSGPGTKRLPPVHQNEGLIRYPVLPHQRTAYGWSQQLAA